jgi:hypothetical protein
MQHLKTQMNREIQGVEQSCAIEKTADPGSLHLSSQPVICFQRLRPEPTLSILAEGREPPKSGSGVTYEAFTMRRPQAEVPGRSPWTCLLDILALS